MNQMNSDMEKIYLELTKTIENPDISLYTSKYYVEYDLWGMIDHQQANIHNYILYTFIKNNKNILNIKLSEKLLIIKRLNYLFYILKERKYNCAYLYSTDETIDYIYYLNAFFAEIILCIYKSQNQNQKQNAVSNCIYEMTTDLKTIKYYYNKIVDNLLKIGIFVKNNSYVVALLFLLYDDETILLKLYNERVHGSIILLNNFDVIEFKIIKFLITYKYKYESMGSYTCKINDILNEIILDLSNKNNNQKNEIYKLNENINQLKYLPPDSAGTEYLAAANNFGPK